MQPRHVEGTTRSRRGARRQRRTDWTRPAGAPPARPEIAGPYDDDGVTASTGALAGVATALPLLAERIDRAAELLQAPSATPGLAEPGRWAAALAQSRLRALVDSLEPSTALHGEPHEANVIWTESGPLLIDFEGACAGPLEWDVAYLTEVALAAFPDCDDEAVAKLRAGVSFCVAVAATHHLDVLRRSWLAARE
ncbi:MAG: phosphotransferase family protein [Mycobacteriales bacterium]